MSRSNPQENDPESLEIPILHQDESFVAVSKPGGLLVHRTGESRDTVFLLQELGARLGRFLFPVHRLDRAASGVIAFAFSSDDARLLQAALAAEETRKEYLVLARGSTPEAWEVDRPLTSDAGVPRPSRTTFLRVAEMSGLSLLRAVLFTGRRHQIRRHLAGAAHQVLGDTTYGKGRLNRSFRESYGLPRLFLHAARLEIPHPRTGGMLSIAARLPQDLRAFLERLPDCPRDLVDTL